jgi:DUF1680 family protein
VYCFEQADQAARLDELEVVPGAPLAERTVTLPGIGRTIQVTMPARHVSPAAADPYQLPRADQRAEPAPQAVAAVAIPYFQWDNRGPGAMRVWIPVV